MEREKGFLQECLLCFLHFHGDFDHRKEGPSTVNGLTVR